jgi:UDP-glucose 4-epimerase
VTPTPKAARSSGGERAALTVAVTGAGGYIGSRLVPVLAGRPGVRVRCLTRQPVSLAGPSEQLTGDLLADDDLLARLCQDADALVHLAGPDEVLSAAEPAQSAEQAMAGAFRVAAAASAAGVRRVVYLSTVHVYGARLRAGDTVDEETPCEPRAAYAVGRLAAEHVLAAYGPPLVVFRVTNAVGAPGAPEVDRWTLVANDLCRQGATSGRLRLRTDGMQWRDFVPLTDVCRVVADAVAPGALAEGVYNLGSGEALTVRTLAAIVAEAFAAVGHGPVPLDAPEPRPDPPDPTHVSVARLGAAGWKADGALADAVSETVRFCLLHRSALSS